MLQRSVLVFSGVLALVGCKSGGSAVIVGDECAADRSCPTGFFCRADGKCVSECRTTSDCSENQICQENGRCLDRGLFDGGGDGTSCASVDLETQPVTPTVILVVDQSSSMTAPFGSSNRWDVLRDTLLDDPGGLIVDLQEQVLFGLALFSARSEDGSDGGPPIGECPIITSVDPAISNYDAIDELYGPADVIEDTPTGDTLAALLEDIEDPTPEAGPIVFILATDGEPDTCEQLDPQEGQEEAIAAATAAYEAGIRTYVISVGEGSVSEEHLQDMANAGTGRSDTDAPAEFWVAGDDDGLRDALSGIVAGELSCTVELSGRVDVDMACEGHVALNGNTLTCDDANGWRIVDEDHMELLGEACDEFLSQASSSLEASFPCDVILI